MTRLPTRNTRVFAATNASAVSGANWCGNGPSTRWSRNRSVEYPVCSRRAAVSSSASPVNAWSAHAPKRNGLVGRAAPESCMLPETRRDARRLQSALQSDQFDLRRAGIVLEANASPGLLDNPCGAANHDTNAGKARPLHSDTATRGTLDLLQ